MLVLSCSKCSRTEEIQDGGVSEYFYLKYRDRPVVGRWSWCSDCRDCIKKYKRDYYERTKKESNARNKKRRYDNHEHYLEVEAARRLKTSKNPDAVRTRRAVQALDEKSRYIHTRITSWKSSARKRELEWNITEEYIHHLLAQQDGKCFYLGLPLVLAAHDRLTVSLDRIDSTKGYIEGNVVLCGATVNRMKLDMSREEFKNTMAALLNRAAIWCG